MILMLFNKARSKFILFPINIPKKSDKIISVLNESHLNDSSYLNMTSKRFLLKNYFFQEYLLNCV